MIYFSFHNDKRQFIPFLMVICLFLTISGNSYIFSSSFSLTAKAKEFSSGSVSDATLITKDSLYQNTFPSNNTQYYCFYTGAKKEKILIFIQSAKIPSLSFQLYDSHGKPIAPSTYRFLSSGKKLKLYYTLSPKEGYLLALESLSDASISYTIQYQSVNEMKPSISHQKKKNTNITSSKQKKTNVNNTTSKQKRTNLNNTTSKQKDTLSTKSVTKKSEANQNTTSKKILKKSNKNTTSKRNKITSITLSRTFIQLSERKTTSLTVSLYPKNGKGKCEWTVSDSSILWIKSQKGNRLSIMGRKKGTAIISCKVNNKKTLTASCIVKIK